MKKKHFLFVFLFFLLFDVGFFFPLFFPKTKLIITPEFGGGDSVLLQLPWRYQHCQKIKQFSLPFWSKNIANGYPFLARGEFGPFNPINIFTCLFFDYKSAFNWQIFFHSLLGQIGMYFLGKELGWTTFSLIFFSIIFPFLPIYLANYMQISLVFPSMLFPLIFVFLIRIIKKPDFFSFLGFSFFIGFQFLINHLQISFISIVSGLIFLGFYVFLNRKKIKSSFLKYFFIFFGGWIIGFILAGFQTFPSLEFALQSDRLSFLNFASSYDQNLTFKNFLTLFHPFILGKVKNATYPLAEIAQPWEGTFSIYSLPVFFLFYGLFFSKKKKNLIEKTFLLTFLVILGIALGKNSPFYLIHYLPGFSAFRFPSRFVLILVFILLVLSGFGCEKFLTNFKNLSTKKVIVFICFLLIFLEAFYFFYDFHVLIEADYFFKSSKSLSFLKKNSTIKIFHPFLDISTLNNQFINYGYQNEKKLYYYHLINDLILPNINLVYNLATFDNKDGPQLKRISYLYLKLIEEEKEKKISNLYKNILYFSATTHLITLKKNFLKDYQELFSFESKSKEKIYIYALKNPSAPIQFFEKGKLIKTLAEFKKNLTQDNKPLLLIEEEDFPKSYLGETKILKDADYQLLENKDEYLKIITNTKKGGILYLAETFYPGWQAYIDGKPTKIYHANLAFKAIILPKGKHLVEFKYFPQSFFLGIVSSLITIFIIFVFSFYKSKI